MNVDYSELGYFFIGNSYPYVDLTKLDATQVSNNTDRKIIVQDLKNDIQQVVDFANKTVETADTMNIDTKKEVKVLVQGFDKIFKIYDGYTTYKQEGSVLELFIHFYEEGIEDIVFRFGLKGTVGYVVIDEMITTIARQVSKKALVVAGIFLAADHYLNPYISKNTINFFEEYEIPVFSYPYMLRKNLEYTNHQNKVKAENEANLKANGLLYYNDRLYLEDIFQYLPMYIY